MIEKNFAFNSSKYDLWEIYETIKNFYPIGISRNEGKGIYFEHKGIKEIERIITENLHNRNNYTERWSKFEIRIGELMGKEIVGTTFGQAPSFSSSIILEDEQLVNCTYKKELHFSVSLIGCFYQIYGLDTTLILENDKKKGYHAVNVITTSPFEEFKEPFELVESKILEQYPDYRIVPFGVGQMTINGLEVRYIDDVNCSINKALFNHFLSEESISRFTRGERNYGLDQWGKNASQA